MSFILLLHKVKPRNNTRNLSPTGDLLAPHRGLFLPSCCFLADAPALCFVFNAALLAVRLALAMRTLFNDRSGALKKLVRADCFALALGADDEDDDDDDDDDAWLAVMVGVGTVVALAHFKSSAASPCQLLLLFGWFAGCIALVAWGSEMARVFAWSSLFSVNDVVMGA